MEPGDRILIDVPNRRIELLVTPEVIAARTASMTARGDRSWSPLGRKRSVSPALQAYAALTTNAARGAVRDIAQLRVTESG